MASMKGVSVDAIEVGIGNVGTNFKISSLKWQHYPIFGNGMLASTLKKYSWIWNHSISVGDGMLASSPFIEGIFIVPQIS